MAITSADTRYLKKHLPPHLHPYAGLVAPLVDNHVGWLPRDDNETGKTIGESVVHDADAGLGYTVIAGKNPDPRSGLIQECALVQQRTFTREFALTIGMGALTKAWENWQSKADQFNEAQFAVYARRCILGAILKELKPAIDARRVWAREQDEVRIAGSEERRQKREEQTGILEDQERKQSNKFSERYIEGARKKNKTTTSSKDKENTQRTGRVETLLQFEQEKSDTLSGFAAVFRAHFGCDYYDLPYRRVNDDEDEDNIPDDDDNWETLNDISVEERARIEMLVSYKRRLSRMERHGAGPLEKLRILLPEREENLLLRKQVGITEAETARAWSISRARVTQLETQALERVAGYLLRLKAGEKFDALFAESLKVNETALRKQLSAQ